MPVLPRLPLATARAPPSLLPLTQPNRAGYSHGAIVFNSFHAAVALSGLPMRDFLRDRSARLLWAAMIREALEVREFSAFLSFFLYCSECGIHDSRKRDGVSSDTGSPFSLRKSRCSAGVLMSHDPIR